MNHSGMETYPLVNLAEPITTSCVRTIVVWKRSNSHIPLRRTGLRENHSGMETLYFWPQVRTSSTVA